jgi:hypothetical protein
LIRIVRDAPAGSASRRLLTHRWGPLAQKKPPAMAGRRLERRGMRSLA